jgi:HlyD family secretion protein
MPLPARVTFVSEESQFTPKQVETPSERQKLSFRVKAQLIDRNADALKPGSPGIVWVRLDERTAWPASLR